MGVMFLLIGSGVLLRCEKPVRWGLINETSQHNPTSNQSCPWRFSQPTEVSLA